jgi:hypothetical protein
MNLQRLIVLVMMLLVWSRSSYAQEKNLDTAFLDESVTLKIAQEWASFVSIPDVLGLEKLLNDQYLHIHATALVESKSQFLDALRSGSRKYEPINFEEVTVRVLGNTSLVTGKFNLKVFARGKTIEGVNRFTLVLVKTNNELQVVSFQATPIPQQKENK